MRFDLLFGVGDGVGEAFFDFGEAVGVGVGVGCFVECFRCLAEVATSTAPNKITRIRSHFIIRRCSVRCPQRRIEFSSSAGCAEDSARYVDRSAARSADRMPAGPTDKMSVLRLRELLQDCFVQANSAFEIFERKIFVRRMCAAIGQCESHEQCFDAENFPEFGDNRDAARLRG